MRCAFRRLKFCIVKFLHERMRIFSAYYLHTTNVDMIAIVDESGSAGS